MARVNAVVITCRSYALSYPILLMQHCTRLHEWGHVCEHSSVLRMHRGRWKMRSSRPRSGLAGSHPLCLKTALSRNRRALRVSKFGEVHRGILFLFVLFLGRHDWGAPNPTPCESGHQACRRCWIWALCRQYRAAAGLGPMDGWRKIPKPCPNRLKALFRKLLSPVEPEFSKPYALLSQSWRF